VDVNGVETYCMQSAVSRICSTLCNTVPTMPLLLSTDIPNSYPCLNILQYADTGKLSICLLIKSHYVTVCNFAHTRFLDTGVTLHFIISDTIVIFLIKFPVVHAAFFFVTDEKHFIISLYNNQNDFQNT